MSYPVLQNDSANINNRTLGLQIAQSSRELLNYWNLPPRERGQVISDFSDADFPYTESLEEALVDYDQTVPLRLSVQYSENDYAVSAVFDQPTVITRIGTEVLNPPGVGNELIRARKYFDTIAASVTHLPHAWSRSSLGLCVLKVSALIPGIAPAWQVPPRENTGYMSQYDDPVQIYSIFGTSFANTTMYGQSPEYHNDDNEFVRNYKEANKFYLVEQKVYSNVVGENAVASGTSASLSATIDRIITRDEFLLTSENSGFAVPGADSALSDPALAPAGTTGILNKDYYVPGGPVNNYSATKGLLVSSMLEGVPTRTAETGQSVVRIWNNQIPFPIVNDILGSVGLGENLWLTALWGVNGPPLYGAQVFNPLIANQSSTGGTPLLCTDPSGVTIIPCLDTAIPPPMFSNNRLTGVNGTQKFIGGSLVDFTPDKPVPEPIEGNPVSNIDNPYLFPKFRGSGIGYGDDEMRQQLNLGQLPIGQSTTTSGFGTPTFGKETQVLDPSTGQFVSIAPQTAVPVTTTVSGTENIGLYSQNLNGLPPVGRLSTNAGLILRLDKDINPLFGRPNTFLQGWVTRGSKVGSEI